MIPRKHTHTYSTSTYIHIYLGDNRDKIRVYFLFFSFSGGGDGGWGEGGICRCQRFDMADLMMVVVVRAEPCLQTHGDEVGILNTSYSRYSSVSCKVLHSYVEYLEQMPVNSIYSS